MNISPSIKPAVWGMIGGMVATIIVGFSWGGWMTQGKVEQLKNASATAAVVAVLTPMCVSLAEQQIDKLAVLRQESSWKHRDFVVKAGWVDNVANNYRAEVATACATSLVASETTG